jgi:uncharacterized protein DUF1861
MTTPLQPVVLQPELNPPKIKTLIGKPNLGVEAKHWHHPTLYNPSVFINETALLVRLEEFDDETSSTVVICELEAGHVLKLVEEAPRLRGLQDPYYLGYFKDPADPEGLPYQVIGGVKITVDSITGKVTDWQDQNFRYKRNINELGANGQPQPFLKSAPHSKDLRYVQLDDGIVVCPRPQGEFGGLGRIGFFRTDSLLTLESDLHDYFARADESTFIADIFKAGEWGGVNQMIPLPGGEILIIGHKARRITLDGNGVRQYRPFSGILDPRSGKLLTPIKIIDVDPADFETVVPKQADLNDVIFTGGIQLLADPTKVMFIGGIKDAAVCMKVIAHPILDHTF